MELASNLSGNILEIYYTCPIEEAIIGELQLLVNLWRKVSLQTSGGDVPPQTRLVMMMMMMMMTLSLNCLELCVISHGFVFHYCKHIICEQSTILSNLQLYPL